MASTTTRCPSCASELPAGSRFCLSCGQAVGAASQVSTAMAAGVGAVAAGVGRLISSDSIPVGGLTPGTVLATRYRIIGLLGRGGMGEVYRADDLKLGQPVALKFLPAALSSDPVRRERFFAEVRITRQLAHPNICRVYDIAEVNGQHFLSMEFIDGEDLASLLKRIGYLPNEKALDIARQLLAGLAAAHERGVLHRDLKPSNIMIDGHGRVRITDFGLAIATTEEDQPAGDTSGTPAYMAPEQLAGKGATVRSDIYALGLVLYEILSGKKAFTSLTIAALREEKEQSTPTAPSEFRVGIDPIVERLVMRCLERDPRSRPASVAQLAAALPGGDPLAAAIAAGETPSPELVAASGAKEGLRPGIALALVAFVILGSLAIVAMNGRATLVGRMKLDIPPDALADRARNLLERIGYGTADDRAYGAMFDNDLRRFMIADTRNRRWNPDVFSPVVFWYRQSRFPLVHMPEANPFFLGVNRVNPPMYFAGDQWVELDGNGRLRRLEVIPAQLDSSSGGPVAPDWGLLFGQAGLDASKWTPSTPTWNPPAFADTRAAWEGTLPGAPDVPMRIEAAAYGGKPVSFATIGPWTQSERSPTQARAVEKTQSAILVALFTFVLGGGVFFANRNIRLGRGDRRGATRLALLVLVLNAGSWLLMEHHVGSPGWELYLFVMFTSWSLFEAALLWVLYIAIEPFVRRRWAHILVSWTRLLSGDWRDPLVGRDVLIGCAAGIAVQSLNCLANLAPAWFGHPEALPDPPGWLFMVTGTSFFVSGVLNVLVVDLFQGLSTLFLLFLTRTVVRKEWIAAVVLALTLGPLLASRAGFPWVAAALGIVVTAVGLFVLMRFGLTAFIVNLVVTILLQVNPATFHPSSWYPVYGYAALAIVGAAALYGLKTSLGGRPLVVGGIDD